MVLALDFSMFSTTDTKLTKSASSLESALAQCKNATPAESTVNNDTKNDNSDIVPASAQDGSGFDEWLASDLQIGSMSGDDMSSLLSSPYSALDDSPVLGFDSFASPALFDLPLDFAKMPELVSPVASAPAHTPASTPLPLAPVQPVVAPIVSAPISPLLTTAAVQQAAAALNIPWSRDLELAVMAQAASNGTPVAIVPKVEPVERNFNLATPISTPATPMLSAASMAVHLNGPEKFKCNKKRALTPEEEQDEIIAKRAKNTDAARRSRLKKLIKLEGLEAKVSDLETANNRLTLKVAILETEKNNHIAKETEQNLRIAQLEAKLAEAHAALTHRN
ncbi:hypothetical protein BGZ94_001071 [Podila epigama]|nr:hypothetical protein BGZ94_001071 [Podila epigama]